ncbi:MAG TPA: hypothetical protein VN616_13600 [Puia sp.]|nr:hypothetical protein [Puia sp.]
MCKLGLVVLLSLLTGRTVAQNYFVLIGNDDRQPFYVRVDSQFHSSTPEGHLILAPLKDSDYILTVGFPGQTYPEKRYVFGVHHKDQEFQLKKQNDGAWRLYDAQGKKWMTPQETPSVESDTLAAGIKKDDAFSRMMAGVVHDTAVLYNTFAMEQALADSAALAKKSSPSDSIGNRPSPDSAMTVKTHPAIPAAVPADTTKAVRGTSFAPGASSSSPVPVPGVVKLSEKKSSKSLRQVYADRTGGSGTDTIEVIIPVDTVARARRQSTASVKSRSVDSSRTATSVNRPSTDSTRTAAMASPHSPDSTRAVATAKPRYSADSVQVAAIVRPRSADSTMVPLSGNAPDTSWESSKSIPYINSDCHNYATEYDIDKLRVKMLEATGDDDRLTIARKVFKTKCFYTLQIRALSEVFASDAGKFRFFEAAWPFAADEHFHELSTLLRDPVYIGKFKTMTGRP